MTINQRFLESMIARVYGVPDPNEPIDVQIRRQRTRHYCPACKRGEHERCDGFNEDECNSPEWSSCHGFCSPMPCQCAEGQHPGRLL
jgi:hypothetical protein